jgi:hypothetical protein
MDAARAHAHPTTMPSESIPKLPTIAFDKRRVPQPPAIIAGGPNHSPCRDKLNLLRMTSAA